MTLKPAEADTGIVFRRSDVDPDIGTILARYDHVGDTMLGTTISNEHGISVSTVEHIMAAFAGCRIDNVVVEIDGPEVPVMDGSAAPFVFLVDCAGVSTVGQPRKIIRILETVAVAEGDKRAEFVPDRHFTAELAIDFDCPVIDKQRYVVDLSHDAFRQDICRARTFGYLRDGEQLRALGLAQGASLDNSIVIDGNEVLNEDGLRYSDEFVRHKVLDAVGDLYLAGAPIQGRFVGVKSGHGMNNKLLRALFSQPEAWAYIDDPDQVYRRGISADQADRLAIA